MVAITVVLIIVGLLLVDLLVQFAEGWSPGGRRVEVLALAGGGVAVPAPGDGSFPEGLFLDRTHAWARLDTGGTWRIGLDGGVAHLLGRVNQVVVAPPGQVVREGDPLATIRQGLHQLTIRSPVGGEVVADNPDLTPERLAESPYGAGWLCAVRPASLSADTRRMLVGDDAERWHGAEAQRIADFLAEAGGEPTVAALSESDRVRFQRMFLDAAR